MSEGATNDTKGERQTHESLPKWVVERVEFVDPFFAITPLNLMIVLFHHPEWHRCLRFNTRTGKPEWAKKPPIAYMTYKARVWKEVEPDDYFLVRAWLIRSHDLTGTGLYMSFARFKGDPGKLIDVIDDWALSSLYVPKIPSKDVKRAVKAVAKLWPYDPVAGESKLA